MKLSGKPAGVLSTPERLVWVILLIGAFSTIVLLKSTNCNLMTQKPSHRQWLRDGCRTLEAWPEVASLEGLRIPPVGQLLCSKESTLVDEEVAKLVACARPYSVVSSERLRATAYLTWLALTTVGGDVVETGVYTGGSTGLILKTMLDKAPLCGSKLWAFDSFQGLPPPSIQDSNPGVGAIGNAGEYHSTRDQFDKNMAGMLSNHTDYLTSLVVTPGWFNETLPASRVVRIAFLRLDGDLYLSTIDVLKALYERVVPGGYIYVDDYGAFRGCKRAVDEFRLLHGIAEPMHHIHEQSGTVEAVWWRKSSC